mmetsp:Transcript_14461/g.24692  ORF Transcript_14461/g.24692 Transcript_14461/m.24692 type:complete len:166 (+) Transcript_14461:32-529(+)
MDLKAWSSEVLRHAPHLAVSALKLDKLKSQDDFYEAFTSLRSIEIVVGVIFYYFGEEFVGGSMIAVNVATWAMLEYIVDQADEVEAREASIVDFIQTKGVLEFVFYSVPSTVILLSITLILENMKDPFFQLVLICISAINAADIYIFYSFMDDVNNMLDNIDTEF